MPSSCMFFVVLVMFMPNFNRGGVQADDKNITRLLNNQVIVSRQIMCVLEKSPCDQLGRQLKGMSVLLSIILVKYFFVNSIIYIHKMHIPMFVQYALYNAHIRRLLCIMCAF